MRLWEAQETQEDHAISRMGAVSTCMEAMMHACMSRAVCMHMPQEVGPSYTAEEDAAREQANWTHEEQLKKAKKFRSSWDAKEAGVKDGKDFLHNLGAAANYNTNVDVGQSMALGLDFTFTGNFLGTKSDIADGSLRKYEFRTFNNSE
jgi:hypothetical protein